MIENLGLHPWFRCFLSLLNQHQVNYLLVGGYAARFYGVQRPARDLDLWVPIDAANSAKIGEALEAFTGEMAPQVLEALSTPWRIVRLRLPPLTIEIVQPIIGQKPAVLDTLPAGQIQEIEFLTIQTGMDYEMAFAGRNIATVDGIQVPIVSLEHLKIIKKTGDRSKDHADLDKLPE